MRSISLLLLLSLWPTIAAMAQDGHDGPVRHGCHHFHQEAHQRMLQRGPIIEAELLAIQETIARSDTFDILHYDITLDVTDYDGQWLKGSTTVTFQPRMSGQTQIRFDLKSLTVDSVEYLGQQLSYDHADDILTVYFPGALAMELEHEVSVHYQGTPHRDPYWGGFYFEQNYIYNLGIGLTTIPPNFGKVWHPCFDSFVERATYSTHVKSAGGRRYHGQGDFLGEVQLGGDTVIRSYRLDQAIPTYVAAVAVADYQVHESVHEGAYSDIPVTIIARQAQLNNLVTRFANLGAAIDACEYWYGPYAWGRVGYVATTAGALEIATNVAYPAFMAGQPAIANQDLYTHELGHQWWGVMVSPETHNDMWLKEGPAEYSTHLVREWLGGQPALANAVNENQRNVLGNAHINDDGFQAMSPMPDAHIYGTHTYYKGASVMHNLRAYLGDEAFRLAMSTIQQEHAQSAMNAQDFHQALEEITGVDLDHYFDAQIYAPGFAAYVVHDVQTTAQGDGWNVEITIRQGLRGTDQYHQQVPLTVSLIAADRSSQDFQVVVGGEFTTVQLQSTVQPAMVVLDRWNRLNEARIDFEALVAPGNTVPIILPHVDFRIYEQQFVDSTLLRVEHVWAAPDADMLGPGVEQISSTHYWIVDGFIPEGTNMTGRIFYVGANPIDLDHDLFGSTEQGAVALYRRDPSEPWTVLQDFILVAGNNMNDGQGHIRLPGLRVGQYAFGKGDPNSSVEEHKGADAGLKLYPVPTQDKLHVEGITRERGTLIFEMLDSEGRLVQRRSSSAHGAFREVLGVEGIAPGEHTLRVIDAQGGIVGTGRFSIVR